MPSTQTQLPPQQRHGHLGRIITTQLDRETGTGTSGRGTKCISPQFEAMMEVKWAGKTTRLLTRASSECRHSSVVLRVVIRCVRRLIIRHIINPIGPIFTIPGLQARQTRRVRSEAQLRKGCGRLTVVSQFVTFGVCHDRRRFRKEPDLQIDSVREGCVCILRWRQFEIGCRRPSVT